MTTAQLLTWLRQRLPQLEPGQLPDPAIDPDGDAVYLIAP